MNRPAASRALAGLVALSGCAVETTYQDVAPILEARCNSCHVDGVSTYRPYFTDYESVASLERILRDTVTSREMPPFGMDNTMRCGNNYFADEGLWLTDLELQTLTDWVDDGVPRGGPDEPTDLAAAPVAVEPALERVDRTLEMAEEYAFSGFDPGSQHRCFITDPGMVEPATLSAFEVEPPGCGAARSSGSRRPPASRSARPASSSSRSTTTRRADRSTRPATAPASTSSSATARPRRSTSSCQRRDSRSAPGSRTRWRAAPSTSIARCASWEWRRSCTSRARP
jgi:hypothetical protein